MLDIYFIRLKQVATIKLKAFNTKVVVNKDQILVLLYKRTRITANLDPNNNTIAILLQSLRYLIALTITLGPSLKSLVPKLSNAYIKNDICLLKIDKKMPSKNQIKYYNNCANRINLCRITMSYALYTWCFKEGLKGNALVCKLAASLCYYSKYNKAKVTCHILALIIKQ